MYLFQVEELQEIYNKYLKDNKNLDIELVGAYGIEMANRSKKPKQRINNNNVRK